MKIYSDSNVSTTDLHAIQASTQQSIESLNTSIQVSLDEVDAKQNRNILQLRIAVGASFVLNLLLTGFLAAQMFDLLSLLK